MANFNDVNIIVAIAKLINCRLMFLEESIANNGALLNGHILKTISLNISSIITLGDNSVTFLISDFQPITVW